MNRTILICFRIEARIRDALRREAEAKRRSLSSVIEDCVYQYLKEEKRMPTGGIVNEQRGYARKKVSLPALIMQRNAKTERLKSGKVLDVSLSGLQLIVSRDVERDLSANNGLNEFHLSIILPDVNRPVDMTCKPKWASECGQVMQVGAVFVDADFKSYQALQKYLIPRGGITAARLPR
jgi:hypothetical protein